MFSQQLNAMSIPMTCYNMTTTAATMMTDFPPELRIDILIFLNAELHPNKNTKVSIFQYNHFHRREKFLNAFFFLKNLDT